MMKLIGGGLAALAIGLVAAPVASADRLLTPSERLIVDEYPGATCKTMDQLFDGIVRDNTAYLEGILQATSEHYGITEDNAMDVVNVQVYEYCPRHWDALVAIGNLARNGVTTPPPPILKKLI
jgi:hypothetical protein